MNYARRELELCGWGPAGVIEGHAIRIIRERINRPPNSDDKQSASRACDMESNGEQVASVANLANAAGHVVVWAGDHGRAE